MKISKSVCVNSFAALLLTATTPLFAGEISTTVTGTSDYVFDGISQTGEDPALQASIDYAHDSGFYVGAWGSHVDFGPDDEADIEIDYYAGYYNSLGDVLDFDIGAAYYTYTGVVSEGYNYTEFYLGLILQKTGTQLYTWFTDDEDVFAGQARRTKLNHDFALPGDFSLGLEATYVDWSDFDIDYFHWRVGLARSLGGFDLDLSYHDTDLDQAVVPDSDARIVFTLSRSLSLFDL